METGAFPGPFVIDIVRHVIKVLDLFIGCFFDLLPSQFIARAQLDASIQSFDLMVNMMSTYVASKTLPVKI